MDPHTLASSLKRDEPDAEIHLLRLARAGQQEVNDVFDEAYGTLLHALIQRWGELRFFQMQAPLLPPERQARYEELRELFWQVIAIQERNWLKTASTSDVDSEWRKHLSEHIWNRRRSLRRKLDLVARIALFERGLRQ